MNSIFFLVTALAFLTTVVSNTLPHRFDEWLKKFEIRIDNEDHRKYLLTNWIENDKYIDMMNEGNNTFVLAHNQFSGMDENEFSDYLGYSTNLMESRREQIKHRIDNIRNKIDDVKCLTGCVNNYNKEHKLETINCVKDCLANDETEVVLAETVNWVENGAVTPVKNQGQCGSCWSFSTTGALEGAYYNTYGKLKSFSEQQLVSCDNFQNGGRDHGCNGGLMDNAFNWIDKNGGLCLEADYPYTSGDTKSAGTCETGCSVDSRSDVKSFVDVTPKSDSAMMTALNKQPVSIAIQADQKDFQLYKSGVFTGSCGTKLDHGVLVVGYGTVDGNDYYLVKNSWGTTWGDNGYIKLGRGDQYNNGEGQCGMLMQGSYPEV